MNPEVKISRPYPQIACVVFNPSKKRQKQLGKYLGMDEEEGFNGQLVITYDIKRDSSGGEVSDGYEVFIPVGISFKDLHGRWYFRPFFRSGTVEAQPERYHLLLGHQRKHELFRKNS